MHICSCKLCFDALQAFSGSVFSRFDWLAVGSEGQRWLVSRFELTTREHMTGHTPTRRRRLLEQVRGSFALTPLPLTPSSAQYAVWQLSQLTPDAFLIKLSSPNPPGPFEKPSTPLPSKTQQACLLEDAAASLSPSLALFLFLSLFINEYATLDTKDLTSNELGNLLPQFNCPFQKLCFQRQGSGIHRHKVLFVLLPSGPPSLCGRYHREKPRSKNHPAKELLPGPRWCPLAFTIKSVGLEISL